MSKTATAVASVNGTKINLTIPALSNLAATGTTLAVATGSLHASGGGYNNAFSSGSLIITDGQTPTITAFSTGTVSSYGGYYSGSLAFNYTFAEAMKTDGTTRYVFTRTAGSADAGSPRYSTITSAANASS
ncbi:MAG TPA: hypothetical protein PK765_04050 [bacterium]|nr:hypothetical protein [bacterium]